MGENLPDQDPHVFLNLPDGELIKCTPDNTTLYTFLGHTVVGDMEFDNTNANHAFVTTGEGEMGPQGMYLFQAFHDAYPKLAQYMVKEQYPMVLNAREVPLCDMQAYMRHADAIVANTATELPDYLPSDFE